MKKIFVGAALLLTLAGCASPKTALPTPAAMADFNSGTNAILVFNTSDGLGCGETIFGIGRRGADKNEVGWTLRQTGYATSEPAILSVAPGHYHLNGLSCMRPGYYPTEMRTVDLWFGGVDVKGGEVVYIGTLDAQAVEFKTLMGGGAKVLNAILFTGRDAYEHNHLTYDFKDESAEVLERLRPSHPELAAKLVTRRPPAYITRESFTGALERAYAPNADGTLVTDEQVQARLPVEMKKLVDEAIAKYRAENGLGVADMPVKTAPAPANGAH